MNVKFKYSEKLIFNEKGHVYGLIIKNWLELLRPKIQLVHVQSVSRACKLGTVKMTYVKVADIRYVIYVYIICHI